MEILVFAAIAAVVVALVAMAWRAERQRTRELQELAGELGLLFDPRDDSSHDDEYAQFAIFRRGHSRVAQRTLEGTIELFGRGCRVRMGDFRYRITNQNGKSQSTSTYHFSYLIAHPPWPSPSLLVRREGMLDKLKGVFGFDDIDFESAEFSRRFWVQSNDKRFAYDVLHPRMMEFLLAEAPPTLDLEGGALCISDGQRRWQPDEFRRQLDFLRRFCELWPRHLLKDLER